MKRCRVGTRGSNLALAQAEMVRSGLRKAHPDIEFELKTIKTKADRLSQMTLGKIEGEGLFTKEIEEALIRNEIDLGVHSLKDMPLDIKDGLSIGAVLKRDDPRDALVSRGNKTLANLSSGAKLGTSSLRRFTQVLRIRPDVKIMPLRGNIDTRLRKVKNNGLDAIIISACGLKRLGLEKEITEYLDFNVMLPCVGQGAIAVELRQDDTSIRQLAEALHDEDTFFEIQAERGFLKRLGGGCRTPVGAIGRVNAGMLTLAGAVLSPDGKDSIKSEISGNKKDALIIGIKLADRLIKMGADKLLCS